MQPIITTEDMTLTYLVVWKTLGNGDIHDRKITVGADASGKYTDFEDLRKLIVFGTPTPIEHIMITGVMLIDEM